jgi:plasmid replication initiation protein
MRKQNRVEPKTDKPLTERNVSMSNALARASHGLNLGEKRLIAAGLSGTDSKSPRAFNQSALAGGWNVRIPAMEYAEWLGITPKTAYEQLRDAADDLIKRQWVIVEGRSITKYNWLSKAKYHEKEGWVEIEFTHYTAPHLLALANHFTTYKLKQAAALRSIHSWRLLECLESWKSTGHWKPTIEEFCHAMDAKPSYRKDFGMLRRSVIEPAVKELREKDGMQLTWSPIKAGRKVMALDFHFNPAVQGRLPLD